MPGETLGGGKANPAYVAKALKGVEFPMSRDDLVAYARDHNEQLNPQILHVLEKLPDQEYSNMADVEKSVGRVE